MNVAALILDYAAVCAKRGEIPGFAEFIPPWILANKIAKETVQP